MTPSGGTTFKIRNLPEFNARLKKLGDAVTGSIAKDTVEAGIRVVEGNAVINIENKFSKNSVGGLAGNRSVEVLDNGGKVIGRLTFHSVYACLQERGGVVKSVKGKFLSIPVTGSARAIGSPRNYPEKLHFAGDNSGGVLLDPSGSVIYILKPAVVIPPRPYLRPAIDEHRQEIQDAMCAVLKKRIEEASHGNG